MRWAEDSTNTLADREGSLGQHNHCVYGKHPANIHPFIQGQLNRKKNCEKIQQWRKQNAALKMQRKESLLKRKFINENRNEH